MPMNERSIEVIGETLMESFREDGQVKKRIVESFGKEELLPKEKIKELELKYKFPNSRNYTRELSLNLG